MPHQSPLYRLNGKQEQKFTQQQNYYLLCQVKQNFAIHRLSLFLDWKKKYKVRIKMLLHFIHTADLNTNIHTTLREQ